MTIELNIATIIYFASCVITVCGAVKILLEAKKALQKPLDEVNEKLAHYNGKTYGIVQKISDMRSPSNTFKFIVYRAK